MPPLSFSGLGTYIFVMKPQDVANAIGPIAFMTMPQANLVYGLITENGYSQALELGTHKGASACYIAGALQDVPTTNQKLVTVDLPESADLSPNIEENLHKTKLGHLVDIRRHS